MTWRNTVKSWRIWPQNWRREQAEEARRQYEQARAQRPAVEALARDLNTIRRRNGFEEQVRRVWAQGRG